MKKLIILASLWCYMTAILIVLRIFRIPSKMKKLISAIAIALTALALFAIAAAGAWFLLCVIQTFSN